MNLKLEVTQKNDNCITHNHCNFDKKEIVNLFSELFSGRTDCYGKLEGKCVREKLTDSHYQRHLKGEESLGVYTTLDDGTCNFAVVDFDFKEFEDKEIKAKENAEEFIKQLKARGISHSWMEISKSNLYHVWVFFEESVQAKDIRILFNSILGNMGINTNNGHVEIFPKQDFVREGGVGNYINLPYFGALEGSLDTRIMIDWDTGEIIPIENFLTLASENKVAGNQLEKALSGVPETTECHSNGYLEEPTKHLSKNVRDQIISTVIPYWEEGQRQYLALSLSGYLAKNGIRREETLSIVEEIANTCDDDEITQRIACVNATYDNYNKGKSIIGYSGLQQILSTEDMASITKLFESMSLCKEDNWVKPLSENAFHGVAGEIIEMIEPHSEADKAALLVNFLVGFGNLLGSKVYYEVEGHKHPTKIFAVLVGKTAKARKGTSWGYVKDILTSVDDTFKRRIQTGLSTGEGLISAVSGIEKEQCGDKRLLVVEEEFSSIFRKGGREGNTLTQIIRNAWDTDELHVLTKTSPLHAEGAHISILGHITFEELKQHITSTEIHNGFGNRFLWICVARSKELPFGGNFDDDALSLYIEKLKEVVSYAQQEIKIKWAEETKPLWEKVYSKLAQHDSGVVDALTARAEPYVIRIASIYAVLDKTNEISPEHLRAALEVWRYSEDSVKFIFGTKSDNSLETQILSLIKSNPQGVSRTDISANLNRKVDATFIQKALDNLESKGFITFTEEKTSGRPREIIKPT